MFDLQNNVVIFLKKITTNGVAVIETLALLK